ncbi:MAG TPA: hypothetical protein VJL32_03445 [Candidatus Paceibacterota bacterium]
MTTIRPERSRSFLNLIILFLGVACVACTVWLVWWYLDSNELKISLSRLQVELERSQADTAELKDKSFALLNGDSLNALAASRQLVQDREPQYITNTSQWLSVASRR